MALKLATAAHVVGVAAVPPALEVWLCAGGLFALSGFGIVRFGLPDGLRRHEWLWVLPTGACAIAIAMTPLGFARVPFRVNLVLAVGALAAVSVLAWRRRGWPARPPELRSIAWPLYLGALIAAIALIPMFRSGFPTVIGQGSDAHMAAGSAEFLRHAAPSDIRPELPVDQWWPVWRSKHAIYYAFAAVTELSGLETWQVLSALAALLLALAAVGLYIFARELLGAGVGVAAVAMGIAALDRMVLHTGMHPYFNQTWGWLTFPFSFVLAWWVVAHPSWRAGALLLVFFVTDYFAYPLAAPLPGIALAVFWWVDRRARLRAGRPVFRFELRRWWRAVRAQPRRVRWPAYVLVFLLVVPLWGGFEKITGATQLIIDPNYSLDLWGGDLVGWFPERMFFAIPARAGHDWWIPFTGIALAALWSLRRLPRALAWGLGAIFVLTVLFTVEMRLRDYGWYFHFKLLAFVGPLVILCAVVQLRRIRRAGVVLLAVWVTWAMLEARDEITTTYDELPQTMLQLRDWARELPRGASIRLDVQSDKQVWVAYMLATHPLCSQKPLTDTQYPHVQISRAADFVLVRELPERPFDATGPALLHNTEFAVYRLRRGLPGGDRCSQRMVQTISRIQRGAGF